MLPDSDASPEQPRPAEPFEPAAAPARAAARARALLEVIACSEYPTQLAIAALLAHLGVMPLDANGGLSSRFVYLATAIDTVVLLALIFLFLRASGDRPRDVFLGTADPMREISFGIVCVPVVFTIVFILTVVIQLVAASLRNVPENPFQSLLGSPVETAAFVVVVLIAGGVREELQRAFLLHRFDRHLGGARLGVVVTSLAFGLGHGLQGWDAVVITAVLGAFWGTIYVRRRNVIPAVVSHALFNAGQVLLAVTALRSA